jgi:Transposase DDE domain group 1
VCEKQKQQPFQLSFNASLQVDFQGSRGTAGGGPALVRELDEQLGLSEAIDSSLRVVLDMDSPEISVYGKQEHSAYNDHFESTCYQPLLLFNGEGDCLAAKLGPGNDHSAGVRKAFWCQRSSDRRERERKVYLEIAAAAGENRRTAGQARPILLAAVAESRLARRLFGGLMRRIAALPSQAGWANRGPGTGFGAERDWRRKSV